MSARLDHRRVGRPRSHFNTNLTARELVVLGQAARGLSTRQSAAETFHSEGASKSHRTGVIRKLGASNMMHAVALAYQRGLLALDGERVTHHVVVVVNGVEYLAAPR